MSNVDTMYDEAVKLKADGNLEAAVGKLKEILEIDEKHVLAHSALAVNLQKLGHNEEAIAHAEKVTEIEPNDPFSFSQLSVISQRCGLIAKAEDAMAKANMLNAQ